MAQADRVLSTPPTNTSAINPVDPTRRGFIAVAAGASIISVGSPAMTGPTVIRGSWMLLAGSGKSNSSSMGKP
jgi:hypothetical protein